MKIIFTTAAVLVSVALFAQGLFYNNGAGVYLQRNALLHVQGTYNNNSGNTNNDGVIEVKGDFINNATFQTHTNPASRNRAVKFVGSGTQTIQGSMNNPSSAYFFNLVVDKSNATSMVEMQTDVSVNGSLIFGGTSVTTTSYQPTVAGTNSGLKGLLKTYDNTNEYLLSMTDGNPDNINGFPSLMINGAPTTGYVLTKGSRGSSSGGLQRAIAGATSYVYPIGTITNGFNAIQLNFNNFPSAANVKGKFCDGTTNGSGYVGVIPSICPQCPISITSPNPDNSGYNRYAAHQPCTGNPQWVILEDAILDHGYWSFESSISGQEYTIEAFPNSYTDQGGVTDSWRMLKYSASYGTDVSTSGSNWGAQIESSIPHLDDLWTYTRNMGCYSGDGVPGGRYTGFSHFAMAKSKSNNALPVELIYLKAEPVNNNYILVSWATSLEINNDGFEVLRSTDGINFTNIGWVDGHDNSTVTQLYSFEDHNVVPNVVYYYKLNQIDNDGQHEETYIVSAMLTDGNLFTVSEFIPNPSNDLTKILVTTSQNHEISVKMYDELGQILSSRDYHITAGVNSVHFDTQNLADGPYFVVVSTEQKNYSKKLIVRKQ